MSLTEKTKTKESLKLIKSINAFTFYNYIKNVNNIDKKNSSLKFRIESIYMTIMNFLFL